MGIISRVLIVEDDEMIRSLLSVVLQRLQLDDECCGTAHEARLALESEPMGTYSAILIDHRLPDGDGIELCRWIRSRPFGEFLPIVLCSGGLDQTLTQEAQTAGASAVLSKPFSMAELRTLLESLFTALPPKPPAA